MIYDPRSIVHDGENLDLDAFAFWPAYRSRLEGLGGEDPSEDPDYAFHTLYVACGAGPVIFRIAIQGLEARRGTMILRVHELPDGIGSTARQLAITQSQLVDLIRQDGRIAVDIEARKGNSYAILGHIYGDTIARATALTVTASREAPDPDALDRASTFTSSRVASGAIMVGTMAPTMIAPTSQMPTGLQMGERVFKDVSASIAGAQDLPPLDLWERVYAARVLDRYDMAHAGARGLIVQGEADIGLADLLRSKGCRVSISHSGPASTAIDERDLIAFDPANIPAGVGGYDFAAALRVTGSGNGWKAALAGIEEILRVIKPLGLLVVTVDIVLAETAPGASGGLDWQDLARIALVLLSRGHGVAQLRRDFGDATSETDGFSVYGFVIRRRG